MKNKVKNILAKLKATIILFVFFWVMAILFWQLKDNIFFLFNFGYIATALAIGIGSYELLPRKKKPSARRLAQFIAGIYLLVYLGLIKYENMQIDGFFFYLLGGIFSGAVIHYLVGKIITPVIIGRGWCAGPAGEVSEDALVWLITGNIFYFCSGIIKAFVLKDNRAFCKYLCPTTVIQHPL